MIKLILSLLLILTIISLSIQQRTKSTAPIKDVRRENSAVNIGLIAPHSNFGKREYLRAISSAILGLQKLRGSKLTFLNDYAFTSTNVHFDMMSLTPSPTSNNLNYLICFLFCFF